MNVTADIGKARTRFKGPIQAVEVARRCPQCGRKLYMKLGDCSGSISIKCPKCGRIVTMNLALRKAVS